MNSYNDIEQDDTLSVNHAEFERPRGKCPNPRCFCTGKCMRTQVEDFWGPEAVIQWEKGLKRA